MVSEHVLSALCGAEILQLLAGEAEPGDETRRVEYLGDSRNVCVLGCAFGSWICFQLVLMWLSFMEFVFFWRHCEDFFCVVFDAGQVFVLNVHRYLSSEILRFQETTPKSPRVVFFFHGSFNQGEVLANEMQQRSTWKDSWSWRSTLGWSGCPQFWRKQTGYFFRRCAKRVICESWRFEIWARLRLVGLIRFEWSICFICFVF